MCINMEVAAKVYHTPEVCGWNSLGGWLITSSRKPNPACSAGLIFRRPHLFVGNLPAELDENTFRETMEGGGEVPLSQIKALCR